MTFDERERSLWPPIEVHGPEHRLEGIGEDRRLRRPSAAASPLPSLMKVPARCHWLLPPAQCPLTTLLRRSVSRPSGHVGETMESDVGNRPSEHGIAQELEPLVAGRAAVFRAP